MKFSSDCEYSGKSNFGSDLVLLLQLIKTKKNINPDSIFFIIMYFYNLKLILVQKLYLENK
jgi:hypothetical protein